MNVTAPKLDELSQVILLDDLSDIYYRSIVFPFFRRLESDPKSDTQKLVDQKLQIKLARQIYWGTSITHLDVATKKLALLLTSIFEGNLKPLDLAHSIRDNFWLKKAIEKNVNINNSWQSLYDKLVSPDLDYPTGQLMFQVLFDYYTPQITSHVQEVVVKLYQLALLNIDEARQIAKADQQIFNSEKLHFITMMNYLPILVLLKVYDSTIQTISREYEDEDGDIFDQNMKLRYYEPTAESLFNFIKFDEFLRPHIFDSLGVNSEVLPQMLGHPQTDDLETNYFLKGRMNTIKKVLSGTSDSKPDDAENLPEQLGIDHSIATHNLSRLSKVVLDRILIH
jgi:hypothetical protein